MSLPRRLPIAGIQYTSCGKCRDNEGVEIMMLVLQRFRNVSAGQRQLAIVDMVAFVVLAVAAGVTTGMALMAAVILMSGEAGADASPSFEHAASESRVVDVAPEARVVVPTCNGVFSPSAHKTGGTV